MNIQAPCVVSLTWTLSDGQNRPIDELTEPTEFMFYERWESDEALAAHAASTAPHRLALRDSLADLVDGRPSVTRWRRS